MNYKVERTNSGNPNFRALERKLDEEMSAIYGEMQSKYTPHNIVTDLKTILVYYGLSPIACGCLRPIGNDLAEVKRVFVTPENRGKGISKIVMKELERWAVDCNIKALILETGSKHKAAISLYKSIGYGRIKNYDPYIGDTNSICMKKTLS
jgi:putative acetyltransferase